MLQDLGKVGYRVYSTKTGMDVGFYYMANAGGRLVGIVLSGLIYQRQGIEGCLWWTAVMVLLSALFSLRLPTRKTG